MNPTTLTTETMNPFPDCADFNLDAITLSNGAHGDEFCGEACAIEWANRATVCVPELREKYGPAKQFTDDHPSISRVIRGFVINWNDNLPDADRTRLLKPFVVQVLGTNTTPEDEEIRAWMATDWLCRVQTPVWLRLAGLTNEAQALEGCARIVDAVTARAAQPTLDAARSKAAAARDAAWAAARDAAWAAAGDAARDAAGAAAWDAARDAAGDAAWDAARDAARDAAGDAAWEKLAPTVSSLQDSAVLLLEAMCAVGREGSNV